MRKSGRHLNRYRRIHPTQGPSPINALWGYFLIRADQSTLLHVISSGPRDNHNEATAWEHVSISTQSEASTEIVEPNWQQMSMVKDLFWGPSETVVQFHVPHEVHVNIVKNCLHLWKPPYSVKLPPLATV